MTPIRFIVERHGAYYRVRTRRTKPCTCPTCSVDYHAARSRWYRWQQRWLGKIGVPCGWIDRDDAMRCIRAFRRELKGKTYRDVPSTEDLPTATDRFWSLHGRDGLRTSKV